MERGGLDNGIISPLMVDVPSSALRNIMRVPVRRHHLWFLWREPRLQDAAVACPDRARQSPEMCRWLAARDDHGALVVLVVLL